MPDIKRLIRETVGTSYCREHPLEAVRYATSKATFARHRATPDEILTELGFDPLRARAGLDEWASELREMMAEVERVSGCGRHLGPRVQKGPGDVQADCG